MKRREEIRKADVECAGKLRQRGNVDIPFPAFDVSDGVSMQGGTFRQGFLRQTGFCPQCADPPSDRRQHISLHMANLTGCTTCCLHNTLCRQYDAPQHSDR